MNYRDVLPQSHRLATPALETPGFSGAVTKAIRMTRRKCFLWMLSLAVIISGVLSPGFANAQTVINYPNGFSSSASAITLRGTANLDGSAIQLTNYVVHNASNAWFVSPVNVQGFTTTFTWKVSCPGGGVSCGDGMGFIIMDTNNPDGNPGYWTGWSGAQFSYAAGCTTPNTGSTNCVATNSVLVKFDLFNVSTGEPGADLTGLYTGGEWPQAPNPQYDMAPAGINIQSGHLMKATLTYNGTTLYETVTDTVTNATYNNSYQVNIPAKVGGNTALVGFGGGTGAAEVQQNIESWTYTEQASGAAAEVTPTPTFSPAGGTLSSSEAVEIADSASTAKIYYTTDGSTPGTASNKYTGPISVKSSTTVKAIAVASGESASSVAAAAYTMTSSGSEGTTATPSFSPAAGTYSSEQAVTVSDSTSGATIYYTTNGSAPTTSSTKYTGPIKVGSTETLKAIAVDASSANSSVATAAYTIKTSATSPQTVINFPNGFSGSPSTIEPITTAFFSGDSIQLTSQKTSEAANVYFKNPVNIQNFTTTFTWTAKCPSSGGCGDGMGFIIISTNNPDSPGFWSGWSGGQLSWSEGCTTPNTGDTNCRALNSVLVKFDLFNIATGSSHASLTGLYTRGEWPQAPNPQYDMAPSGINIESGDLMRATLTYNGSTLYETVTDTVTNKAYSNSYSVNIPSIVGSNTAIVGFGGGTGAATVQQNINSWTYTVE